MRIVLSGVETNNKGAELMLYAILQEIERRYPKTQVYLPFSRILQGRDYINTKLDFRYTPYSKFCYQAHVPGMLMRLHLPQDFLFSINIVKKADFFFDASGFFFSDQFNITDEHIRMLKKNLNQLHKAGCKIIFLPQAFGPIKKESTQNAVSVIGEYADLIMPREKTSYDYLLESKLVAQDKIIQYPDFTCLVEGTFPRQYERLRNGVCIIPNKQMINKGIICFEEYIQLLSQIIVESKKSRLPVYVLNHEGVNDEGLLRRIKDDFGEELDVVTGINALDVKGLISSAYLVITSRFHGLVSALNCGVPSLATSWSHKYEELFNDFGLDKNHVLPIKNIQEASVKVNAFLEDRVNKEERLLLEGKLPVKKNKTHQMWDTIWNS